MKNPLAPCTCYGLNSHEYHCHRYLRATMEELMKLNDSLPQLIRVSSSTSRPVLELLKKLDDIKKHMQDATG